MRTRHFALGMLASLMWALLEPKPGHTLTIAAIGDSITWGVTRAGTKGRGTGKRDARGGYPARLAALLGNGVEVLNRGIGGSTARGWLQPLRRKDSASSRRAALMVPALSRIWKDFHPRRTPRPGESLLAYVLGTDKPDVALIFLGVNDLPALRTKPPPVAAKIVTDRIEKLLHTARKAAPAVLVATLLPNHRDPAEMVQAVNERLCALEPDCVRLDRAFASADDGNLLGDEIHPNENGYSVIAKTLAAVLKTRGLLGATAGSAQQR